MAAILLWNVGGTALSQQISAPLDGGFARTSSIAMTVDEMLGSRKARALTEPILGPGYPELWIGEVQYKPVRLMRLDIRDPKTGVVQKELVRYMVYRMMLRDPTELAGAETAELRRKLADPNLDPANTLDQEVTMPLQMPRFILKTEDNDLDELYVDEINPEIQKAVFQREFGRRGLTMKLLNSVEAIAEVGEPVPSDDKDALSKAVYGVAVWRNVNPKTDFFSVAPAWPDWQPPLLRTGLRRPRFPLRFAVRMIARSWAALGREIAGMALARMPCSSPTVRPSAMWMQRMSRREKRRLWKCRASQAQNAPSICTKTTARSWIDPISTSLRS